MRIRSKNNILALIVFFVLSLSRSKCAPKLNKSYPCGRSQTRNSRIVGGDNAYPGEFPWMVSLLMNEMGSESHYCGGILIADQWVLSAAHCVEDYIPDNFIVRLGAHSIQTQFEENAVDMPVESIIIHRDYSRPRPYDNDIALLKLKRRIKFNDYIIPVCLPKGDDPHNGDLHSSLPNKYDFMSFDGIHIMGTVVGWGWLRDSHQHQEPKLGDVLQKVKLAILSNKECQLWYRSRGRPLAVSPTQFCAGFIDGGKDSCRGDSGGPLLVKDSTTNAYHLIGIVSAGIGCALPKLPGLYTRVDAYTDWINRYLSVS